MKRDNGSDSNAPIELSVNAAERAEQLATARTAITREESAIRTRLEHENQDSLQREARKLEAFAVAEKATKARLSAAIRDDWYTRAAPIVAAHDGANRANARAFGALIVELDARCMLELGEPFDPLHVAFAFCEREIARSPCSVNAFGFDAWNTIAGPSILDLAGKVMAAATGPDVFLLDRINDLERAVCHHAANARRDLIGEYAAARYQALRNGGATRCGAEIEAFELEWRTREQARMAEESAKNAARVRRYRAGDLTASEGQPQGWAEAVLKLGAGVFGAINRAVHPNGSEPGRIG
jgi:hypothetical protein